MKGPYTIEVRMGRDARLSDPEMVLTFEEMYYADGTGETRVHNGYFNTFPVSEAVKLANRFYNRGADATMRGTEMLAQFYMALLLEAGEEAILTLVGTDGGERAERSAGSVRRDEHGRAFLTYGSRFGERHFRGI